MHTFEKWKKKLIIVRGGGDIATGTIYKLHQSRFPVLVLEIANPSCIRRTISFCEAGGRCNCKTGRFIRRGICNL